MDKRKQDAMENESKVLQVVRQNRKGISAQVVAGKVGLHRATVHSHLNSLELRGLVSNKNGLWYPGEGEQTSGEIVKKEHQNLRKLWGEVISLCLNPKLKSREDGSTYEYRNIFEIIRAMRILSKMHPKLEELTEQALKRSICNPFGPNITPNEMKQLTRSFSLTPEEWDSLIGEFGKAIDEIIEA